MTSIRLIRDYENTQLSIENRLPSLARRFPCLVDAPGLEPFSAAELHSWLSKQVGDSSAWHAGHLILNLYGKGPWATFDAVAALKVFDLENRAVFANWVRCWR